MRGAVVNSAEPLKKKRGGMAMVSEFRKSAPTFPRGLTYRFPRLVLEGDP